MTKLKENKEIDIIDELIKETSKLLGEDCDKFITIPLKDFIWTMVIYKKQINDLDELMNDVHTSLANRLVLKVRKESMVARCDELGRVVSQYSDFDTSRVWTPRD